MLNFTGSRNVVIADKVFHCCYLRSGENPLWIQPASGRVLYQYSFQMQDSDSFYLFPS